MQRNWKCIVVLTFNGWLDSGGKRQDAAEDGGRPVGDVFVQTSSEASPLQLQLGRLKSWICQWRGKGKGKRNLQRFTDGKLTLRDPDRVRSLCSSAELPSEVVVSLDTETVNFRCTQASFNSGLTLEHSRLRFCSLKAAAEVFRP